jgi:hypothetical protein
MTMSAIKVDENGHFYGLRRANARMCGLRSGEI